MEVLNFHQVFSCRAQQQPTAVMKDFYYQMETLLEHANKMAHTRAMLLVVLVSSWCLYRVKSLFVCVAVKCSLLPNPSNGRVRQNGVTVGSQAAYKCNRGFSIVGNLDRTCQTNGQWSGEAPICRG